jgi:hypothetical protein
MSPQPLRFPANCLAAALVAWLFGNTVHCVRNSRGRWHWFWRDRHGRAFEFYRRGASRFGYLRLLLYVGEVKPAPALNATPSTSETPSPEITG